MDFHVLTMMSVLLIMMLPLSCAMTMQNVSTLREHTLVYVRMALLLMKLLQMKHALI